MSQTSSEPVNTTYYVKSLSDLSFTEHDLNKSLTDLETALEDYAPIINDIKYVYQQRQQILKQAEQIDALNAENNELVEKIISLVIKRDDELFELQIEEVGSTEQQRLLARLLNITKRHEDERNGQNGGGPERNPEDFEELLYTPFKSKELSKRQAVGLMGKLDRTAASQDACTECGVDYCDESSSDEQLSLRQGPQLQELELTESQPESQESETVARLKSYKTRVESLVLESKGLQALLAHRIGELDASRQRVYLTLQRQKEEADFNLEQAERSKAEIVKDTAQANARLTRLESDNAAMAATGVYHTEKTKKTTDNVLRNARREMKIFEINKEREINKIIEQTRRDGEIEFAELLKLNAQQNETIRELKNRIALIANRNRKLEKEVEKEGLANGEMREILAKIEERE